jgi:hypothetical protein
MSSVILLCQVGCTGIKSLKRSKKKKMDEKGSYTFLHRGGSMNFLGDRWIFFFQPLFCFPKRKGWLHVPSSKCIIFIFFFFLQNFLTKGGGVYLDTSMPATATILTPTALQLNLLGKTR